MYKHTVTRVRPNTDVKWVHQLNKDVLDVPVFLTLYDFLTWEAFDSQDGLTRTTIRTAENSSTFSKFEADLNDPTSQIYPVTQYYEQNNVTCSFLLEQI